MIRFIHTADVHYGMENYGRIDPASGIHSRLLDFDRAFNACIDYALNHQVDFFLFAGDAYKTTHPSPTQQRLFTRALMRLHKASIPVIIVVGNHDNPLSFGKATTLDLFKDLPLHGFHIINKPTMYTLLTKSGPIQIVGIPWPTKNTLSLSDQHQSKTAAELTGYLAEKAHLIIKYFAQGLNPELPALLTGHLTVASGIFSGSEKRAIYGNDPTFLASQLAIKPFDYVGLGHLHRFQNLNVNGHPPVVYSGSIERIDFGERKEDKGFCLVTLKNKTETELEFIKTPQRPFIQIEATISSPEGQTSQLIEAIKKYPIKNAIVKIMYHLPPIMQDTVDLAAVHRVCHEAHDVVGIFPVHQIIKRKERVAMHVHMKFEDILATYLKAKPEYASRKEILTQKALALYNELMQDHTEES